MYQYTKTPVSPDRLSQEIQASAITVALDYMTYEGTTLKIYFKAELSAGEITILDSLVSSHTGVPLEENKVVEITIKDEKTTSTGIPKMAVYEPEGGAATIVSINYADRCSWYMGAIQVTTGSLNNTGLVYSNPTGKTHWIDLEHGRLYDEDNVMAQNAFKYKVKVYVAGVQVTTGFVIDYEAGTITFSEEPAGAVTASYWYADKSWYIVKPKPGKVLSIKVAEVQFSEVTTLVDSGPFVFELWFSGHPVYGTMAIPGQKISYKNAKDFISACNEGQGLIPKWGELTEDVHVFPFHYARPKPLKYTDYIEIRVYCTNHLPVTGEYATTTFYVTIDDL